MYRSFSAKHDFVVLRLVFRGSDPLEVFGPTAIHL